MQATSDLHAAARRLARNATFVGLLPAVAVGAVLAVLVHPLLGAVVALVTEVAWVLAVRHRISTGSTKLVRSLGATPLAPGAAPRLENLLEGLCLTSGVEEPERWVLETPSMNALIAASDSRVDLVVTRGLLEGLDRLELEGVLANLLGRVRDGSAAALTLVAALGGDTGPARAWRARHLGAQWLVRSDLAAVDLTRYPPGLLAALARMSEAGTTIPDAPAATACSWLVVPFEEGDPRRPDGADLELRMAVLAEL